MSAAVSVVIPTQNRAGYLEVALASLADQQDSPEHEVLVVDDGSTDDTSGVAERAGARLIRHDRPLGLNAARNTGIRAATAPLIAFLDDDVWVPPGWLSALIEGAARHPDADAFGGPIRARFEGPAPSSCGREPPPITTLDLGPDDVEAEMVWGANLAIRRTAFDRIGLFDQAIPIYGDEEDWLLRLKASGGRIVYLADAGLDHRRAGADARLSSLARSAYRRGRASRAANERRYIAPSLLRELRILTGCAWHCVHYACPQGVIMGAHSAGRLREALLPGKRTRRS